MNFSAIFISRPVATTLLTIGIAFAGGLAFLRLSVAPLPQVDFPALMIQASMSGASPDVMAATVAAPLERHLGFIADVTEMTSRRSLGSTQIDHAPLSVNHQGLFVASTISFNLEPQYSLSDAVAAIRTT